MSDLAAFAPWPKIPRMSKPMVVTEKIDGTNAAIVVRPIEEDDNTGAHEAIVVTEDKGYPCRYAVYAQSKRRIVTPDDDNFGFANWVHENALELAEGFGIGRHFGEWWGVGINRAYGQRERFFSPFNSHRWNTFSIRAAGLNDIGVRAIPILCHWGSLDTDEVDRVCDELRRSGSHCANKPGYPAEGVVVYHSGSGTFYKRLLENDNLSKSEVLSRSMALAA